MVSQDNYSVIKVVEQHARRIRFHYNNIEVNDEDKELLVFAFTSLYCIGIDLRLGLTNLSRTYLPFLQRHIDLDIIQFGLFSKDIDGIIKNYTEDYSEQDIWTYTRFKHACSCSETYWDFIAPIKGIVEQYLRQPDPHSFRIINQWVNFLQRCNIRSLDLTSQLVEKYKSFELDMLTWTYPHDLVKGLSVILDEWCETFQLETDFVPKHGPGSIAGRKGRPVVGEKYKAMGSDIRLEFLSKYVGPIASYTPLPMTSLNRCSDLVFVPKSLITQRTISKEPASLQYFQQGVARSFLRAISRSDASIHIDLEHQEYSRTLAQKGSVAGKYATIDLSDASDSVSVGLVKSIFNNAMVRNSLICCRSDRTRIEYTNEELVLSKFAPMGASTCFPVETVVFAACCELVSRRFVARKPYYRVYGDDIIVDYCMVDDLLIVLEQLHFKVNKSKSFWRRNIHNFREACGGEYFDSVDVTPLRIPRKLRYYTTTTMLSSEKTIQYISLANKAFEYGFSTYRLYIFQQLKRMNKFIYSNLFYSVDGKVGLATWNDCCTNYRLRSRWNSRLYLVEKRGIVAISLTDVRKNKRLKNDVIDDNVRLFEWYRQTMYRDKDYVSCPESIVCPDIRPKLTILRQKWHNIVNGQ